MDESALWLARLQFGVTLTYHFLFVALTLGLSILIAYMETVYVRTGNPVYRTMAKFWGKLFLVNYAVGVVTGLVNEFQFGMNWAEYSRFVGSVFGPPLAFEATTAFFVESIAIGVWTYGWGKVSRRVHLVMIWLVALAANYSAFWILAANSFMQHPTGFALRNGRVELVDLAAVVNNPYLAFQYSHTLLSGLTTAGFFVMSVSAYYLSRGQCLAAARRSFGLGLRSALLAVLLVTVTGHYYNQYLGEVQPMKLAAMEALWENETPAPFLLAAVIDEGQRRNMYQLALPGGLSALSGKPLSATVRGMNELQREYLDRYGPANYIPPVTLLFWCFRGMVGIGLWLLLLAVLALWYWCKDRLEVQKTLLQAILWSLPLPYIAVSMGWVITEVGRQPWLVYGLLLTESGVSGGVSAASVWTSLLIYSGVYAGVAAAALYIACKIILAGPGEQGGR